VVPEPDLGLRRLRSDVDVPDDLQLHALPGVPARELPAGLDGAGRPAYRPTDKTTPRPTDKIPPRPTDKITPRPTDKTTPRTPWIHQVGTGLPSVLRFIAGCAPVYLGFGMLGSTLFGSASSNFSSLRSTLVSQPGRVATAAGTGLVMGSIIRRAG
jgi:hypothetical protein